MLIIKVLYYSPPFRADEISCHCIYPWIGGACHCYNNEEGDRWAKAALKGCFEATDLEALREPHRENIDGLTGCISDYIKFCVDIYCMQPSNYSLQ